MRGATLTDEVNEIRALQISIHAPHARSDFTAYGLKYGLQDFNPRSSCEERQCRIGKRLHPHQISIHAPHARSDPARAHKLERRVISIHAPHARSDHGTRNSLVNGRYFNPRSSCEERRGEWPQSGQRGIFQSTLLMRGATESQERKVVPDGNFNPRSSCEERRSCRWHRAPRDIISIHAPHARSDGRQDIARHPVLISIHAPHARSDSCGTDG